MYSEHALLTHLSSCPDLSKKHPFCMHTLWFGYRLHKVVVGGATGLIIGVLVGLLVGDEVGELFGILEGDEVGKLVGLLEGDEVSELVGLLEGDEVGVFVGLLGLIMETVAVPGEVFILISSALIVNPSKVHD